MKIKIIIPIFVAIMVFSLGYGFAYASAGTPTTLQGDPTSQSTPPADPTSQSSPPPTPTTSQLPTLKNPLQANSVTEILTSLANLAIFIGTIVAVLMFIYIGFKFVMAQGNETELSKAKEWFKWAVIGTAILISSKVIVEVVKQTFISAGVVDQRLFTNKP